MFAQEQFLKIEATKNIVFEVNKDFKHCFFEGFQIANFALLQKVKEFKTSNFAKFERSLYLISAIFKISNFKTSKDKKSESKFGCKLLGALLRPPKGGFRRSGRCLWRNVKYIKNTVFYSVFWLPGPPGGVRNRSKIDPGSLLDVSWDQRSVWRAQVEVHKGQLELHKVVLDPM